MSDLPTIGQILDETNPPQKGTAPAQGRAASDLPTIDQILGGGTQAQAAPSGPEGVFDRIARYASGINDAVQNLGTGVVKGFSGLLGAPRDANLTIPGLGLRNPAEIAMYPRGKEIERFFFDNVGIPEYKPETAAGRVTQHVGELAGGSPLPGAGPMVLGGGLLGGTMGELTRGTPYEKWAQLAGDVVGSGAVGAYQAMRSTPGEMISRRTQDVTPQQWADAAQRQAAAKAQGVPLLGPESVDSPGLHRLAGDTIASAGGGPGMDKFLQQRPGQVAAAVEGNLNKIGPTTMPESVATRVENAATQVIRQAESARSNAAGPFYRASASTKIPQPSIDFLLNEIDAAKQNVGASTVRQLEALADDIRNSPTIGTLHSNLKSFRAGNTINIPQYGAEPIAKEAAALAKPVERMAVSEMEATSPMFAQGQKTFRSMSPQVDALKSGDVGRLANPNPGEIANVGGKLLQQAKIITDPNTARPDTIRNVARELGKVDETAFRDLARIHMENAFNQASKDVQAGANRMSAPNFRNSIAGTQQQRDNLKAILEEIAKSNGQSGSGAVAGFGNMLDTFERMGKVPNIGSPTASRSEAFSEARNGGLTNNVLDMTRLTDPLHVLRNWWQDTVQRENFAELARVFTDPNSVELMRKMAITGPNTARTRALMVQMGNVIRSQNDAEQPANVKAPNQ